MSIYGLQLKPFEDATDLNPGLGSRALFPVYISMCVDPLAAGPNGWRDGCYVYAKLLPNQPFYFFLYFIILVLNKKNISHHKHKAAIKRWPKFNGIAFDVCLFVHILWIWIHILSLYWVLPEHRGIGLIWGFVWWDGCKNDSQYMFWGWNELASVFILAI